MNNSRTQSERSRKARIATAKSVNFVRLGWLFVFLWLPTAITLFRYSPLNQVASYLNYMGGSLATTSAVLLPSVLVAIPLIIKLDFSKLSSEPSYKMSSLERAISKTIAFAVLVAILWVMSALVGYVILR